MSRICNADNKRQYDRCDVLWLFLVLCHTANFVMMIPNKYRASIPDTNIGIFNL